MFQHNERTFHLTSGLFFERLPGGQVRIRKQATASLDSPLVWEVITDASGWASIVDAMREPVVNSGLEDESNPSGE